MKKIIKYLYINNIIFDNLILTLKLKQIINVLIE